MHNYFVSLLIELLRERGIQSPELFKETGLTVESIGATSGLPAELLDRVFSRAIELADDPQLGVILGSRINIVSQGIFCLLYTSDAADE